MSPHPRANGVHATYVSRVLRLTLLGPEIVEAILDGRQPGARDSAALRQIGAQIEYAAEIARRSTQETCD